MLNDTLFFCFIIVGMIHIIHIGAYVVGANVYDIVKFKHGNDKPKQRRRFPLVTVVVPAHNEETGIIKTLDSIRANTYPNVEIVVVDDGSSDRTAQRVQNYIRRLKRLQKASLKHAMHQSRKGLPKPLAKQLSISVRLARQANAGKGAAVNNGIRNYAKGSLVMTLDADSTLDTEAISRAVEYFRDSKVLGVAANVRVLDDRTILGVLQKIEHVIGYRTKKFFTVANCEFVVGGVASTYRLRTLKEVGFYDTDTPTEDIGLSMKVVAKKGNRRWRIVYAADVVADTEGVQSYKALFKQRYRWKMGMLQNLLIHRLLLANSDRKYSKMLTWYRIPMAYLGELILLIEPVILVYVVYLSIINQTTDLLFGAYSAITLYVIWNLAPDEHFKFSEKVKFGLLSPYMYFIFYIMSFVQIAAVIRCIKNYKIIIGKVKTDGVWTSPERAAAQVQ